MASQSVAAAGWQHAAAGHSSLHIPVYSLASLQPGPGLATAWSWPWLQPGPGLATALALAQASILSGSGKGFNINVWVSKHASLFKSEWLMNKFVRNISVQLCVLLWPYHLCPQSPAPPRPRCRVTDAATARVIRLIVSDHSGITSAN